MADVDFLRHGNSPTWAGVEPATISTEGQRQTNQATLPAYQNLNTRAIGSGLRNFVPWSSEKDDIRASLHSHCSASYTRAFSDGPRHFETWSSAEETTPELEPPSPNYHTNRRTFELSTDLKCIAPLYEAGSHKEIPITYGYTQNPFKNRSQNFKPKVKENYPQYLERENKNCFICGDSSHCARDCEKRFKPKESNDHIHNKINVNTLKIESEKQNSEECTNLQYVNIFVENQPVTALIDSGCQIPVLNSSLIRVQTPSEKIITLSSYFGEQRMVEVKPINISLNQHSTSLSVGTAISPTLTEEFIIHPSVYSEIEKLGHAKSDVLLNESESSLGTHAYAYSSAISFPNVSVSNVIEKTLVMICHILKTLILENDLSSLIKNYKLLCKKANGAMKTSSVEFISRSPNPLPMKSKHHRFSSGLHGNTAADSVRSEWPLWHAAKSNAVFARRRIEMKLKPELVKSEAYPQVYVETPLHPEKLTVWCALWTGEIIGPYFFKNDEGHNVTVNGDRYRAMITNFFIPELNNHDVQELWFQQDGATCHTARATIDLLKDTFGDRLISRFGPVNWPPRSCDLTPLDYFLWGYVKSLVHADKPQTLDHLEDNIRRVIADIRPQMLEKVIESWTSRLDYIRASRGNPMPEIIFKM
ncbi:transposase [Trichonephila clavipes]|nr:transposase [Trichonephila clavipes]